MVLFLASTHNLDHSIDMRIHCSSSAVTIATIKYVYIIDGFCSVETSGCRFICSAFWQLWKENGAIIFYSCMRRTLCSCLRLCEGQSDLGMVVILLLLLLQHVQCMSSNQDHDHTNDMCTVVKKALTIIYQNDANLCTIGALQVLPSSFCWLQSWKLQ